MTSVLGCVAGLLRWAADLIDQPRSVTDEEFRELADTVWTDTDCSLFHGYADD